MQEKIALVVGATGLVGSSCVRQLLAHPAYAQVHVIVRRSTNLAHPRLQEHVIDFEELAACVASIRANDVFCCLGTTLAQAGSREQFRTVDYEWPLLVANAAKGPNLQTFVCVSSVGANPNAWVFYSRVKGQLERDLAALSLPALLLVRPSLLLGQRPQPRLGETIGTMLAKVVTPLLCGKLRKYQPIAAEKVAEAMVHLAGLSLQGVHIYEGAALESLGRENRSEEQTQG